MSVLGYVHSAFVFGYESHVNKSKIDGSQIPPGALLSFMQRGVNFVEIEESLVNGAGSENGTTGTSAMDGVTSLLDVHKCLCSEDFKRGKTERSARERGSNPTNSDRMDVDDGGGGNGGGTGGNDRNDIEIPPSDALMLRGHHSEVFVCTWNPKNSLLASASGDSTARIWPIPNVFSRDSAASSSALPVILQHPEPDQTLVRQSKNNDVTTLSWNPSGQYIATGCYDGCARIWSVKGELKHTLRCHKGPLFSLKWNKEGSKILSGSVDASTAVWDGETGSLVKQFKFHNAPTLDVDWCNNTTFASCSTDKMIYMCSINNNNPVQTYEGHRDEINCLQFDPSGTLLASCSDDFTAKVWTANSSCPAFDLKEHHREVYTLQWAPNHKEKLILATASFDASVKLWDIGATGKCIRTLSSHTDPVYSLDFSPNAEFLATGSFDRCINIWSVKDGTLLKKFRGDGGIFEVTWNPAGDKVAACFSSNTVTVLDMRKLVASTTKI